MNGLEKKEEKRNKLIAQRDKLSEQIKILDKQIEAERMGDISRAAKEVNLNSKEYRMLAKAIRNGTAQRFLQSMDENVFTIAGTKVSEEDKEEIRSNEQTE